MTAPLATVLVVTWNAEGLLNPCLASLRAQTVPVEVLVVDNASADGTLALLRRDHPEVRVLASPVNTGFAGGCALGLAQVTTPYAVLLNNDAVAAPDFVEQLLAVAQEHPGVAAVTARVLLADRFVPDPDGPVVLADGTRARPAPDGLDVLNSTGNEVRTDGLGQDRGWLAVDRGQAYDPEVFGFCGAAALLRTAAVAAAGGFDPAYFLYYEDTDVSWRLRQLGWDVRYAPRAVVRHEHSASAVEDSDLHRFHVLRNSLLTLAKSAPARLALAALLRVLLTTASGLRRELPPWRLTRLRLRALASFARLLPAALRTRRDLGRRAVRARSEVASGLVPAGRGRSYRVPARRVTS